MGKPSGTMVRLRYVKRKRRKLTERICW